jgi:phenylalanyl-tRNA synthetase alpha chain
VAIHLTPSQLQRDLAVRDLTDPEQGEHALKQLVTDITRALTAAWGCTSRVERGTRIVTTADNYDNLGFDPSAVTRDARYTRYVNDGHMLRSHSSAVVPPTLRALVADLPDDLLLVCPGIVYRRDSIDRTHTGTPHQLDLWRISSRPLDRHDLEEMIDIVVGAALPEAVTRREPRVHPYTEDGLQIDVAQGSDWIEIGECGTASPAVLCAAGLERAHGLAMGVGLDRLLMLRKGLDDIRLLRSADARVLAQMHDLSPYRPVSTMPHVTRDISIAVESTDTDEDIGDRVRTALGSDADVVESVVILSETEHDALPLQARQRLGIGPSQKNILVRIVLRPYDRTLSDHEANELRDRIYAALHRGSTGQWVAQ